MEKSTTVRVQFKKMARKSNLIILMLISHIVYSQSGEAYFNSAQQKFEFKDFQGSIEDYTKCLALEPNLIEAYHNRALAKCNLKDYEGAILDHDKCISIDSTKVDYFYNRARAKYFLKDFLGCISDNTYTIKLKPEFALGYLNRGLVRVIIGNTKDGCVDLIKATELGAENAQAIMNEYCK